jgi:hypothetical protein
MLKSMILIASMLISGCNGQKKEEEVTQEEVQDFKSPGGSLIGDFALIAPINLTATPSSSEEVALAWTVPSIYFGLDYIVWIYRVQGDETVTIPEPSNTFSGASFFLVDEDYEGYQIDTYTDRDTENSNNVSPNTTYTYRVYIQLGEKWSDPATVTTSTTSPSLALAVPSGAVFWESFLQSTGTPPLNGTAHFVNTIGPSTPVSGDHVGDVAVVESGSRMYISDTANNRILIYANTQLESCEEIADEFQKEICISIYANYPMSSFGVLGQLNLDTAVPCGDVAAPITSSCLTKPKGLWVEGDTLYVADSGNDRILVYSPLPLYGCNNILKFGGQTTDDECAPVRVIGKQSLTDTTTYVLATDGDAALSSPSYMSIYSGDLYISDTGNNRIVLVKDVGDQSVHLCAPDKWKTSFCSFSSILGQPDLFTNEVFDTQYDTIAITYNLATSSTSDSGAWLKKHFQNPGRIVFEPPYMYVATDEGFSRNVGLGTLEQHGRIMAFDQDLINGAIPVCRAATWNGVACDATYVIGQGGFEQLSFIDSGTYTDVSFNFKSIDFDLYDSILIASSFTDNRVLLWSDYSDTADPGVPYASKATDPEGIFNSTAGQFLPDLKAIGPVHINEQRGSVMFLDSLDGRIHEVRIFTY